MSETAAHETDHTSPSEETPRWERRFRAATVSLPDWASHAPQRAVAVTVHEGVRQIHSLDVPTGTLMPLTNRPSGTMDATLTPDGAHVWWFDDDAGDEFGVWRRQPWGAAPGEGLDTPLDLPAAYSAGLLMTTAGGVPGAPAVIAVGSSDDDGSRVHVAIDGVHDGAARLAYSHAESASVASLSEDGTLLVIEHSEHGDSRHPSLRVLATGLRGAESPGGARAFGDVVADLHDGEGKGLAACGFAPVPGDARLLVVHERRGTSELAIWDVATGEVREIDLGALGVEGEVADADWTCDATGILVAVDHAARTRIYRLAASGDALEALGPDDGTVSGATARPDGAVWLGWSSAAQPRTVLEASTGEVVVAAPGEPAPSSVIAEDVWTEGPGGRIHALLRRPAGVSEPLPVVVEVHGGPTWHESDSFAPDLAAWVDAGYAVLTVNYRGSTGYGAAWRDALEEKVGFTELDDIAAVHDDLVARGVVDPARSALVGASWGGYLTLLGLGTQPGRWAVGVADVPVADYVAAYEDEMEQLKAFDRALFGGSPQEVPEAYRISSPLTYVDQVSAPLLVLAGENDPRCPIRQIRTYLTALRAREDAPMVETYEFGAGHGSYADDERVAQMRARLAFVERALG
ncbi:S9 family peptidase [Serinibacter salmoneus]|uniref:Prolyl oligopeptidase family protein n=1 Tax=Serinibacter salmoneus TaxID=556530 RepID=A0A2A9D255_9MICO|nr:prolyl oligopeptidase family serine peptidase [Serinibacter salmoneus]PFG20754.1 prolyl oligopeptidase family protein [Serinibacter salmoneus]